MNEANPAQLVPYVTGGAFALAFIFGWRFFNPFIRAALPLGEDDAGQLHEAMREELRHLQHRDGQD